MQGGSVLVVEDDVFTRFAVGDHLRDCGYDVLEAETGREAIDFPANGAAVDVVFTDVQMPGDIDGFGVVRWLRENRPELPVLVVSGHALALELASKLCDVQSAFAKPYHEAHVAAAVAQLLDGKAATA